MKRDTKRVLLTLTMIVSLSVILFNLTGCSVESITKEQRINLFVDTLNTVSRSDIRDHFSAPGSLDSTTLDAIFSSSYSPFTLSDYLETGNTVTFTLGRNSTTDLACTAVMTSLTMDSVLGGENWKIVSAGFTAGATTVTLP